MSVECCICSEALIKVNFKVSSTPCGHVYHSQCLTSWIETNNRRGICPVCRNEFQPSTIIPLHSLNDNQANGFDGVFDLIKNIEKKTDDHNCMMNYVVESLNNLTAVVADIKKEKPSGSINDQLRAKDVLINSLKTEVKELKAQRVESMKQMEIIKKQLSDLRKSKQAFKSTENVENQQPEESITLSLKFDDISDQMILGDFD